MKALILILTTAVLLIAGCQAYGTNSTPEPSLIIAQPVPKTLMQHHCAPPRCPFIQAGHS